MGNEGNGTLVVDVASSSMEASAVLHDGGPAIWLIVGVGLAFVLWGRKFAAIRR